jgi:hypothetical protein
MKIDSLNILACVLFFMFGFLLGSYLSFPTYELGNVAEIISALGTVAAVVVGALALGTWKNQFAHQERYKNIVALETAFHNALSSFHHYRYKFLECAKSGVPTEKLYEELDEYKSYQEVFFKYRQQWNATTFALDEKTVEQFEFKPDQLHGTLIQFLNPIMVRYDYEQERKVNADVDPILNFENEIGRLSDKGIKSIRTLINPQSLSK